MLFALICKDKHDAFDVRMNTRPEHLAFLEGLNAEKKLAFAGPFVDADGKPDGSLVVVETPDRTAAEVIASADPYAKAGLFDSVEIRQWNWGVNKPAGA